MYQTQVWCKLIKNSIPLSNRMSLLVQRAIIASLDSQKSRNKACFFLFYFYFLFIFFFLSLSSSACAYTGERSLISFIYIWEGNVLFGQNSVFTLHHYQNQNISSSCICCFYSITTSSRSISLYVPLHWTVSSVFHHILPLPHPFWDTHMWRRVGLREAFRIWTDMLRHTHFLSVVSRPNT